VEPVTLDDLDRKLLHALQVDARASFGRIAEVLDTSDRTLARRYARLRAGGLVRVVGLATSQALGEADWLVRLRCLPDAAAPIADVLAARADTTWVSVLSGGAEIACHVRSADDLVLATMPRSPRIGEVTAQRLLRAVAGVEGWPRRLAALTSAEVEALRAGAQPVDAGPPVRLTAADRRAVERLSTDGRADYSAVASAAGWSAAATARRIAELRRSGALVFTVDVEPALFGARRGAMLWLTVAPAALGTAGAALARHPDVAFAAATTGATNLMAYVVAPDDEALYEQVLLPVGKVPGVGHIDLAPISRRVTGSVAMPRGR
jgi:DNA-binding Lrp family transcriptional regulator